MGSPTAYELYHSGLELLEQGDNHAAALPLGRARDLEPSTAMVREALGRALFGAQRYREAADEFAVLVELQPLNHYGQFCLGRALQLQGLHARARPPLTMAALLQPDRADYRVYRDRTIAALQAGGEDAAAPDPAAGDPLPSRRSGAGPWGAPDEAVPAPADLRGTAPQGDPDPPGAPDGQDPSGAGHSPDPEASPPHAPGDQGPAA